MFTKRKKLVKQASSAADTGGKIKNAGVEVTKNTQSVDHWDFLDKIEAPMWADLSMRDLTTDETDESWFETSHQFHQCSASHLLSTIFHPESITIQEPPPSPKLPPSVSKSRGKNYKTKSWGQTNDQHPVKTLTIKSFSNNTKPTSIEPPKVSSSCESNLTNTSRPKISKSSFCSSSSSHEQKQEGSAMSTVTSDLLSSLRNNLRRSCATRPAARMVVNNGGRSSEGVKKSFASKSSIGSSSSLNQVVKNVTRVSQPLRSKSKVPNVTNAPAQNVTRVSQPLRSKSIYPNVTNAPAQNVRKALMPRKINEQCQMIDKEAEQRGVKKTASVKNPTCQKAVSGNNNNNKEGKSVGVNVQKVTQKNGSKKLIGLKEKTDTRSRDKDATRNVYFR